MSDRRRMLLLAAAWLAMVVLVVGLSAWRGKLKPAAQDVVPAPPVLAVDADTTLGELAQQPPLNPQIVAKALKVKLPEQAGQSVTEAGLNPAKVKLALERTLALKAEHASKDFGKIRLKFTLWFLLLTVPAVLLARKRLSPAWSFGLLGLSVAVFGVWLGSDPSPMGTVKDALVLSGRYHAQFPPRLIALGVFLVMVVVANKLICSWGCQLGTLQELLYRLNRTGAKGRPLLPVLHVPYAVANTIRLAVFAALCLAAFAWGFDLIAPVDPFKIFSPAHLGWLGVGFILLLLLLSPVLYRPWCTLACPFGLVAWLFERLSLWRPRVDYAKCIACHACEQACPTSAMRGLLRGHALPQDCFSCGDCLVACPTDAVRYAPPWKVPRASDQEAKLRQLRQR